MLIRNPRKFLVGLFLIVSFGALFWAMFLPLFQEADGRRINALQWTDSVFNRLAKGSSWFVPEVMRDIRAAGTIPVNLAVRMPDAEQARICLLELAASGIGAAGYEDGMLRFNGDLSAVLMAAVNDSAELYNNEGDKVSARYGGIEPLKVSVAWWRLLNPAVRLLQMRDRPQDAKLVEEVIKKAIEPANNFYGMPVAQVSQNILLVCGLLAFYVLYAIWYGFAIYNLFAGFGLLGKGEAREDVEESEI